MNTEVPRPDDPVATIPRATMEAHIAAGRAKRWEHPIDDMVPLAALLDGQWIRREDGSWAIQSGTWYLIWDDGYPDDVYELAPPDLAAHLSDFHARLRTAGERITEADAQSGASLPEDL